MTWPLLLAALVSLPCFVLAALFALWATGRALPEGDRAGLAREVSRTDATAATHRPGQRGAPTPLMLWVLSGVFLGAALVPWGLAADPGIGRWRFVFAALGAGYCAVFFSHAAGLRGVASGTVFGLNDRRWYTPLAAALAAGYAALLLVWFF